MPSAHRLRRRLHGEHGYGLVLGAVTCSFVYQCAAPDSEVSRAVAIVIQCTILVFAVWASREESLVGRLAEGVAVALAVAALVLVVVAQVPPAAGGLANGLLVALAPGFVVIGLAGSVRRQGRVTVGDVSAVLSIYLLIGLFFSFAFAVVGRLTDGGFFAGGLGGDPADYVYFSFSTLTTTGFGDFVARTDLGHTLAVLEALIGQVYLVTIVALIVGNLRPRRNEQVGASS